MAGSKTFMNENPREIVVSTDITRIGKLAAREQQNAEMERNTRADFVVPGNFDDFGPTARNAARQVIVGALKPGSLQGQAGTFDMLLGAGEAQVDTGVPADPDVSAYQIARWADQPIAWPSAANPDGSLWRIATIYCSPMNALTDLVSRNILLNPVTRPFAPENVYKTSNPSASIAVVASAPATTPMPPALPPNTIALFDVLIPPSSTQSSDWCITRRCWRRIEFPGSSQHGIVKGCVPKWDYADESTGSAPVLAWGPEVHRLVIDGELLTFGVPTGSNRGIAVQPDSNNPPGAAPAGNDMPTYLYLCGGRNAPVCIGAMGSGPNPYAASPVVLLESLTPPDAMGYPTAGLAFSGTTLSRAACLFVGCGFRIVGTTLSKSVYFDGDWVRPQSQTAGVYIQGFKVNAGDQFTTGSTTPVSLVLGGIPSTATVVELQADIQGNATTYPQELTVLNGIGGSPAIELWLPGAAAVAVSQYAQSPRSRIARPGSDTIQYTSTYYTSPSNATVNIRPTAYNMNIPRLGR